MMNFQKRKYYNQNTLRSNHSENYLLKNNTISQNSVNSISDNNKNQDKIVKSINFVKGMTLDEYFSSIKYSNVTSQDKEDEQLLIPKRNNQIPEIEEENYTSSLDSIVHIQHQKNLFTIRNHETINKPTDLKSVPQNKHHIVLATESKQSLNARKNIEKKVKHSQQDKQLPLLKSQEKLKIVQTLYGMSFMKKTNSVKVHNNKKSIFQRKFPLTCNRGKISYQITKPEFLNQLSQKNEEDSTRIIGSSTNKTLKILNL